MGPRRLAHPCALLLLGLLLGCGGSPSPAPNPGTDPPVGGGSPPGGLPTTTLVAADGTRFGVQTLATGLQIPWSLAFTPDGRLLISERPGRVRVYQNGTLLAEPALTLSDAFTTGESGILGLAVHPDFATNHFVYLTYTANGLRGPIARLMRFREVDNRLAEGVVLLDDVPAANIHNGSRVRFGPDRRLYVTFGDVATPSIAQDVASLNGKVLRLNEDGTSAAGNRFSSPVFSFGHRNPQGIDWHPVTGDLWETEHGQTNNDEINVIDSGVNYGWPVIEADEMRPDMATPITFFVPAVAPSGASFYRGTAIPAFRNQLFVATLRGMALLRVTVDGRRITAQERLLENRYGRLRDVVSGLDGYLYFCTSNRDGRTTPVADDDRLLRIVPVN
ncbi:MAG: PQQ-dependent sugar dehydrogenase [Vicinamibacteria bacterium]|nr:PQQ-dependent sugar dehydrogenase [Vicinamibacteria bacterium]